jgi:tRNA-splicing ligase RtcB (3'-phosphate/5'-hydroxy nucleic acid ligase)
MQQSKNLPRLLRALSRQGLQVSYQDRIYSVRLHNSLDSPIAEVLLPEELPVEGKALKQLANLATISHPLGGQITRICATPDFHPGDAGVAIGSIIQTQNMVIPAAIGSDINCGMRLHVADLSLKEFLSKRTHFVELMKGDYFLGTRDVSMDAQTARGMFQHGILGWLEGMSTKPMGSVAKADFAQLWQECEKVYLSGSLNGSIKYAPSELIPETGIVRDGELATIGGGNHFVEIQVVEQVEDTHSAYAWGIKEGQLAFMIHSGSRSVGKYIGGMWRDKAWQSWQIGQIGVTYPNYRLFPLSTDSNPNLVASYLEAEATAANYAFVNRLLLAELLRLRLRQVYGSVEAPLVYDLPHNITLPDGNLPDDQGWIVRKGACPADLGQPAIIPGSMGSPSYLVMGLGCERFLASASHGAGRAKSRFSMSRQGACRDEASLGLTGVDCITLKEERRIEEAPAAYKPIQPIIDAQVAAKMIKVVAKLKPVLTFKA